MLVIGRRAAAIATSALLAALALAVPFQAAATPGLGGPVILGGDDLTDHGGYHPDVGNYEGWLYLENAIGSVLPAITRPGDGTIAALGSADPVFDPTQSYGADAGAAVASAAAPHDIEVTFYPGESEIEQFFASLATGAANPSVVWIAGTGSYNDLSDNGGTSALAAHAQSLGDFVRSGGALISHGVDYTWLGDLLPGVVMGCGGGSSGDLQLTEDGTHAFPGITDTDINAGPWHGCFEGNLGELRVLVESNSMVDSDGNPAAVIIGGARVEIEPPTFTALGDSYSAGEGTGDYYPGTDVSGNRCHRSPHAYGPKLDEQLSLGDITFAACSGAVTRDFIRTNHNYASEPRQLLGVSPDTDNVTFTIGGNDVGFANVLGRCVETLFGGDYGCSRDDRLRRQVNARIAALGGGAGSTTPDGLEIVSVETLLRRIHRRAPDAFIVVAGYPQLFGEQRRFYFSKKKAPSGYACDVGRGATQATVDYDDAQWLNSRGKAVNAALRSAVRSAQEFGVPVRFVDPAAAFGSHRFCGATANWFYKLSLNGTKPDPKSFHPTREGQVAYQDAISGLPHF